MPYHKINKVCRIFLFNLIISFFLVCSIEAKQARVVGRQNEAKHLIKKYYSDYVLMAADELHPFAGDFFKRRYQDLDPSVVCADFDGNGFLDFAFLLRNKKEKNRKTLFTILLQVSEGRFRPTHILSMEYRTDVVIIPIGTGQILSQTESIDTHRENVHLKNSAIELIYVGKASVAYYWDDTENLFKSITTGD